MNKLIILFAFLTACSSSPSAKIKYDPYPTAPNVTVQMEEEEAELLPGTLVKVLCYNQAECSTGYMCRYGHSDPMAIRFGLGVCVRRM